MKLICSEKLRYSNNLPASSESGLKDRSLSATKLKSKLAGITVNNDLVKLICSEKLWYSNSLQASSESGFKDRSLSAKELSVKHIGLVFPEESACSEKIR